MTDTDGDSTPNYLDTDSDGDGIPDSVEGVTDTDGDSTPNYLDTDSDADGIPDSVEGATDTDGDSTPNYLDTDSDGDGIPDSVEGAVDTDGDSIPDYLDTDSDGDGIPDANESATDSDGDGIPDFLDTSLDEDKDGIPDIVEGTGDSDLDGILDFKDPDSDNDGLSDTAESGITGKDTDGDGIDDRFDVDQTGGTDTNADGIDDNVVARDSDANGVPDYRDIDSDGDGIPDVIELVIRRKDSDSDNIIDAVDSDITGGVDTDGDSIDDRYDVDFTLGRDADGDGIDDLAMPLSDVDKDGIPDYLDLDSDNDGIADTAEGNVTGLDTDGDGIDNRFDIDETFGQDVNGDGIDDAINLPDTDGDSTFDLHDLDSDNDSLFDVIESGGADANQDGIADMPVLLVTQPIDADNDGTADFRDIDSNGDGVNDIETTPASVLDKDKDGQIDSTGDTDGDGIDNSIDEEPTQHGSVKDRDNDGVPGLVDKDQDGDGISDAVEGTTDSDGDSLPDFLDLDSDNDGLPDAFETDRPAAKGSDADSDGIDDAYDVDLTGGADTNQDGVDDAFAEADTDGDGTPDYLDTDADNDGISDSIEQISVLLSGADDDNDNIDNAIDVDVTGGIDLNNDGIDDSMISKVDTDGDGILNFRDADSDNDGIRDGDENGDFNGDGVNDRLQKDGGVETGINGAGSSGGIFLMLVAAAAFIGRFRRNAALSVVVATLLSSGVQAEENCHWEKAFASSDCWYVGGGMGYSQLEPEPRESSWVNEDKNDIAYKLFAGYPIKKHFFAEVSYEDMGSAVMRNLNPAITDKLNVSYKAFGTNVGYWLRERNADWNLYAKVGVAFLNTSTGETVEQDNGTQLTLGAGIEWNFADNWFARLDLTGYDKDASVIGINIAHTLGNSHRRRTKTQSRASTQVIEKEPVKVTPVVTPAKPEKVSNPDIDADGVLNEVDECPATPAGAKVNSKGCQLLETVTLNLQFDTGSSLIDSEFISQINKVAAAIKTYNNVKVTVEGHTDWQGKQVNNQPLSESRAKAVAKILMQKTGLSKEHFETIGYGELKPVADNRTPEGRYKNRRVVVLISQK